MENIFYYLALFLLVFIIRYFKLKKQYRLTYGSHKLKLLHVSLELIYTASGIIIALLLNIDKKWIPVVIIFYIILVITSSLLEMANEEDFKPNFLTKIHGLLVIFIILFSLITYTKIIPNTDINGESKPSKITEIPKYAIIIPYTDESLQRNAGKSELKNRKFMYYSEESGINKDSIKRISIAKLKKNIKPLYKDNNLQIVIYEEEIIFSPINSFQ